MDIDLQLYKIFYVVAKYKHMTRASEELYISQPAISQSIKKLEEQLGGTLFLRSNKGMELTEEGKMMYNYIKQAMENIDTAEKTFTSFKDLSKGEIKIGCSTTLTKLILLDVLKQFHKDYPNINIVIKNALTSELVNDVKQGKLDFVIFNQGYLKESGLKLTKIKQLKQGFIYNPNFYKDNIQTFADLKNIPLILQKTQSNSRKLLDNIMLKEGIVLSPSMEVVSQELVCEFTDIGFGVGFVLIDIAKRNLASFKELNINKQIPKVDVYLAHNKTVPLTFASKIFTYYLTKINL